MAPITTASNEETHAALLDTLDMHKTPKPFRNPNWKPTGRRNKNLKQILSEASRAQQSVLNTQQNSGASTPLPVPDTDGSTTPSLHPNPAQASQDLTRLVLEKNLNKNQAASGAGALTPGGGMGAAGIVSAGPSVTYTSIAAAPSFKPKRKYCDITGLPAKYTEPTTGLHYYNKELYPVVKGLSTSQVQEYKAARGAATVLKEDFHGELENSGGSSATHAHARQKEGVSMRQLLESAGQSANVADQPSSAEPAVRRDSALGTSAEQAADRPSIFSSGSAEHVIQQPREVRSLGQVNRHDRFGNPHFENDTSLAEDRGRRRVTLERARQNIQPSLSDAGQEHAEDEQSDDNEDEEEHSMPRDSSRGSELHGAEEPTPEPTPSTSSSSIPHSQLPRELRDLDQVNRHDKERNPLFHTDTSLGRGVPRDIPGQAGGMQTAQPSSSEVVQNNAEAEERHEEGDEIETAGGYEESSNEANSDQEDSDYED